MVVVVVVIVVVVVRVVVRVMVRVMVRWKSEWQTLGGVGDRTYLYLSLRSFPHDNLNLNLK